MKSIFLIITVYFVSSSAYASCNITNPNDILDLIKKGHPSILMNKARGEVLEKSIEQADQTLNPEVDAESTVGDSIEGNVYTIVVTLKHTFELGGKKSSRVDVAKANLKTGMAVAEFDNENTIIDSVLKLYRLRQIYELIPLYEESLNAFNKILRTLKGRKSISPEQRVERETLELVTNDYKLKMSQLDSEKVKLSKHLTFFTGTNCILPRNALPSQVNLSENFESKKGINTYSKIKAANSALELAKAKYEMEKANSYPDLKIGPTFEYEKLNVSNTKTIGLAVTFDLPIFNVNGGGRAQASKEIIVASSNLRNIKNESHLDLESWLGTYQRYKKSLLTTANKKELEEKHQRIEALFRRGIISTSLVIESHRQLIEFSSTRFEFEIGALEALWNIYKMNGNIANKRL
jgi:cobalt-zinc-cadmium efflux system outer membrane protein